MGNQTEQAKSSWILQRYSFQEQISASSFGRISVFRKKQQNYDYLMVMSRTVQRQYLKTITAQLQSLTRHRNAVPFLRVYNVFTSHKYVDFASDCKQNCPPQSRLLKKSEFSCFVKAESEEVVNVCMEYLNYTLLDHISYKKRLRQQIWLSEYAYILKQCVAAAELFDSWQLTYLTLDLFCQYLLITPSGEVKMLPFRSIFLKEESSNCECFGKGCMSSNSTAQTDTKEIHTYSYISLNKKQSKFVKQIKNIALELFSTVNLNLDPYLRKASSYNSATVLSLQELGEMTRVQSAVNKAVSLEEIRRMLEEVEDDFILIGNQLNTETNKAIMRHSQVVSESHHRKQTDSLTDRSMNSRPCVLQERMPFRNVLVKH